MATTHIFWSISQSQVNFILLINRTHDHPLKFVDYQEKGIPEYAGGYSCNECGGYGSPAEKNWYCSPCSYDLCKNCFQLVT